MRLFKPYPLFLFLLFFLLPPALLGQTRLLQGAVRDTHSEEPVPFASVSFKGSTVGKLTDSSGSFSFILDQWPSDTLEITCVGYQPYRHVIDRSKDKIELHV